MQHDDAGLLQEGAIWWQSGPLQGMQYGGSQGRKFGAGRETQGSRTIVALLPIQELHIQTNWNLYYRAIRQYVSYTFKLTGICTIVTIRPIQDPYIYKITGILSRHYGQQ